MIILGNVHIAVQSTPFHFCPKWLTLHPSTRTLGLIPSALNSVSFSPSNFIAMSWLLVFRLNQAAELIHVYVKFWYASWLSSLRNVICTTPIVSYVICNILIEYLSNNNVYKDKSGYLTSYLMPCKWYNIVITVLCVGTNIHALTYSVFSPLF